MSQLARLQRTLVAAVGEFGLIETGEEAHVDRGRAAEPPGEMPTSFAFAATLYEPGRRPRTYAVSVVEVPSR